MSNIRQSLVITFLASNGATAVHFLVTVILARLLSPEEIGIYSITAVLVTVGHFFRDFGVGSYLQQQKNLTKEGVSAAFGVLLVSSTAIAAIMYVISGPAARYYQQPGIQDVMQVLALGYLFIPFGAVTHCLLTRDYRAKEQAYVTVAGTTAYAVSVVGFAMAGFSYMSMPWANLVNILVTALAYLPFRPKIFPYWPRLKGWRKVVHFGAGATLGNSLSAVNNAIPDLVLGKLSGPHDVGVLSRSMSTTMLLNQILGPTIGYAILPYFSKAHHAGHGLQHLLAKGTAYLTGLMWPAMAATAIYADPLIRLLYGEMWLECVPVVQIVCFMLMIGTPFGFISPAFMAVGKPYLSAAPTAFSLILKCCMIFIFYEGTLNSFAWAMVAAAALMYPVNSHMQKRIFSLGYRQFWQAQIKSVYLAASTTVVAVILHWLSGNLPTVARLLLAATMLPATWAVLVWKFNHPLRPELVLAIGKVPPLAKALRIQGKA